jgi:hypothetical protein
MVLVDFANAKAGATSWAIPGSRKQLPAVP